MERTFFNKFKCTEAKTFGSGNCLFIGTNSNLTCIKLWVIHIPYLRPF